MYEIGNRLAGTEKAKDQIPGLRVFCVFGYTNTFWSASEGLGMLVTVFPYRKYPSSNCVLGSKPPSRGTPVGNELKVALGLFLAGGSF